MIKSFPRIPDSFAYVNPSALHREGVLLRTILESARAHAAESIGAHPDEIIFTGSATESDNLALQGVVRFFLEKGIDPKDIFVYTSPFEHAAGKETLGHFPKAIRICELPQEKGVVLPKSIIMTEPCKVLLVSVLFVQNETGLVQPIKDIAKRIRKIRKEHPDTTIIFHVDATQAPLFYSLNVNQLGVDLLTLGATKLYTPKGIGMLYKKRSVLLSPILFGGGQEKGLRPATEAVELIHTFAHALSYAQKNIEQAQTNIGSLQNYVERKIEINFPFVRITKGGDRSPHITHFVVPGIESELLVLELDARGIALSSKSACKNEDSDESGAVALLYPGEKLGAVRLSYGRKTKKRQLDVFIKALHSVFKKYSLNKKV